MIVYGIPNCNTVKKATAWLEAHNIDFEFYDVKKRGISRQKLEGWSKQTGWEVLVNKKGTTWRKLQPEQQALITGKENAISLMMENTSVIKRPVIEVDDRLIVGFNVIEYEGLLNR